MAKQKKNVGCLGSLIYMFLLICAMVMIISFIGGVVAFIAIAGIVVLFIWIVFILLKKACQFLIGKYSEKRNKETTLIQKLLAKLKMNNQVKDSDICVEEISSDVIPKVEKEKEEKVELTEDEIIENYKKQYYIVNELEIADKKQDIPDLEVAEQKEIESIEEQAFIPEEPKTIQQEEAKEKPVRKNPKPQHRHMNTYEIEQYARECNAYVIREERRERQEREKHINSNLEHELMPIQYDHILFSESIDTDAIIGSRRDYMGSDYSIDPIFYDSHKFLYRIWEVSKSLEKVVEPKRFFDLVDEMEKSIDEFGKYRYPKFDPEKEKEYYYSKKENVVIDFLNRSFATEYKDSMELKTTQGKINRITNWFAEVDSHKETFSPNAREAFEVLVDRLQFEILPMLLEPENMKEI